MNDEPLKPQTTLRDYVIKRVLGRGSFGVTYLAQDAKRHFAVAIKEYFPFQISRRGDDGNTVDSIRFGSSGPDFHEGLEKFLTESRTLSGFESPHIVRVVDTFEHNGTAYMVMQYEEGATLTRYLQSHQEPFKEAQILSIFIPLLEGLRTVHAKWVLHRDIKPDNIYIRKDGSPLLIDFGTARHALSAKQGGMTEYLTPGYAPPEQYNRHGDHGPWTDIYAVGATIYNCVTRIIPYEGRFRTPEKDPVVPATQAGPVMFRRELLEIIDWMMKPAHRDRPQSVEDVLIRLARLREEELESVADAEASLARNITRFTEEKRASAPEEPPRIRSTSPKQKARRTKPREREPVPAHVPEDHPSTEVVPDTGSGTVGIGVRDQAAEARQPPSAMIVSVVAVLLTVVAATVWLIPSDPGKIVAAPAPVAELQNVGRMTEDQQTETETRTVREPPPDVSSSSDDADDYWKRTVETDTPEAYRQFLSRHPDSRYASLATIKLEALERDLWKQASEKNTKAAYEDFVALFPNSRFARLATLRAGKL